MQAASRREPPRRRRGPRCHRDPRATTATAPRRAAEEDTRRRGRCNHDQPERLIHPSNHDRLLPGNASPREVPPQQSPETGHCRRPRRHRSGAPSLRRYHVAPPRKAPAWSPRPAATRAWDDLAGTAPERRDRARQPAQPAFSAHDESTMTMSRGRYSAGAARPGAATRATPSARARRHLVPSPDPRDVLSMLWDHRRERPGKALRNYLEGKQDLKPRGRNTVWLGRSSTD